MSELFRIDPALVERCIMSLAEIGAYGETGVARATYTPEWAAAQELVSCWCRDAGMDVRMDTVGSVWGRVEGTEGGKSIVSGSHIDSQCPGGRYDGALGVIAAYIAISTLRQRFGRPKRTLEVVSLCEEEGSRYPAGNFWGSRAITGRIAPGDADTIPDLDGGTIAGGMRSVGLDPDRTDDAIRNDIDTYVELHIEQGPLLEQAGVPVAVVTGITGLREDWITLKGRADHAGARPMDLRRDPMAGAAEIISNAINTAHRMGRPAVTTIGRMTVEPNASPIVPERVSFTIDARHPDPVQREILYARHEAMMREVAQRRDLELSWEIVGEHAPALSDPALVQTFVDSAVELGIPNFTMPSGAAHDAQQIAAIAKIAMIFVQSKDGRSHTPEEFTSIEHASAGIEILTAGLYKLAYE
jgi:allantoate deiminase